MEYNPLHDMDPSFMSDRLLKSRFYYSLKIWNDVLSNVSYVSVWLSLYMHL